MHVLLATLLRRFRLEYPVGEHLGQIYNTLLFPDKPVRVRFIKRDKKQQAWNQSSNILRLYERPYLHLTVIGFTMIWKAISFSSINTQVLQIIIHLMSLFKPWFEIRGLFLAGLKRAGHVYCCVWFFFFNIRTEERFPSVVSSRFDTRAKKPT